MMGQPGMVASPGRGRLNRGTYYFSCLRSRLRIWSRETGLAVPLRVSPLILRSRADPGAYLLRSFSRFPRRRHSPFIYLYRQPPSGQSRVDEVTQLRTDGVHCRESAGAGPVDLKEGSFTNWSGLFRFHHEPILLCCCCHPIYSGRQTCGCTSRGHTGGRPHMISHPPSFCGASLNFSRE